MQNAGNSMVMNVWLQQVGEFAVTTKVELQGPGDSGWQSMRNVWGAAWEMPVSPKSPLGIRITDDSSNTVRQLSS